MKSTILLAFGLFLASAPSPDAQSVAEMSAGFLSPDPNQGLMAAESAVNDKDALDWSQVLATVKPCDQAGEYKRQSETICEPEQG